MRSTGDASTNPCVFLYLHSCSAWLVPGLAIFRIVLVVLARNTIMKTTNDVPKHSRKSRWDAAILALLQNATREDAAKASGIDPATLYRWQKDPEFQRAFLDARQQVFGQAMGRLQQGSSTAVDTLIRIMNDEEASVSGRVQAARCVLELSRKSLELDDLRRQVAELQRWRRAEEEKVAEEERTHPNA
jgi:hypothetical protein